MTKFDAPGTSADDPVSLTMELRELMSLLDKRLEETRAILVETASTRKRFARLQVPDQFLRDHA
jgi:hypothetical protein